jgi:hypothetical protein
VLHSGREFAKTRRIQASVEGNSAEDAVRAGAMLVAGVGSADCSGCVFLRFVYAT